MYMYTEKINSSDYSYVVSGYKGGYILSCILQPKVLSEL